MLDRCSGPSDAGPVRPIRNTGLPDSVSIGGGKALKEDMDTIGAALARIPSGCSILTAEHDGRSTGMLASWVQQAAFRPPSVTVCLKQGRPACELVEGSGRFLLNIIGEDPTAMFKHFGKGFSLDEDAFAGLTVRSTGFGPAIEACIAHLVCRVANKIRVGDHDVYVGEVSGAGVIPEAKPYTHLRKSGLSY